MAQLSIPLIEVSGDPLERGRAYGEAARDRIAMAIDFYAEAFVRSAQLPWSQVTARALGWVPLIEDYLPGILEEVRGIAEGSGRTFGEILALNGRGELSYANPFADDEPGECTSFALMPDGTGDGHVYCGQNWDWRNQVRDTLVLLRVEQEGKPTILMQVEAGQVGRHGVNSAGLALNANGLGARFSQGIGVPGTFIRRRVLEQWDMHGALRAVFRVRQAFSTNLVLTHRDGFAIDVETTPGRHGWLYPSDGVLVHANHFESFIPTQVADDYRPNSLDTLYRGYRARQGLMRCRHLTVPAEVRAQVRSAMSDHFSAPNSVCTHPDPDDHPLDAYLTVASSLVDLTTGEYRIAVGPPCENDYELVPHNIYDGPTARPRTSRTDALIRT
ncbi:C45 family peptidase [Micromonospora sp. NPDC050200]|uniref:C45 family peptidase n=1 Tax=Micromonospora sp. NPDC050200 TaxID=3155664 RepID=UPI003404911E